MRILGALLIAVILPLGGCARVGVGGDTPLAVADLPQNYIVFFDFGSSELDETAQGVIAQAAQGASQHQPTMIEIAGFSGEGPNVRTSPMANQRYAAVVAALVAQGLDSTLFTRAELMDEPNLDDLAIRRVEIHLELP
jgi:hypothetical protein